MSNTSLLTIDMITNEILALFVNTNSFLQLINRQYEGEFGVKGNLIGNQIRIRLPLDFTVRTGQTASANSINEQKTVLVQSTQKGVDFAFSSAERYQSVDNYSKRFLEPAVNNLLGAIAVDVIGGATGTICNVVSNGTGASLGYVTKDTVLASKKALIKQSVNDVNNLNIIVDASTDANVVGGLTNVFNPANTISKQYLNGEMSKALGYTWAVDQTVQTVTTGAWTTATLSATAGQTGGQLVTAALPATINAGDFITIAGVNAVNKVTKSDQGELRQFVVTATASVGATTVNIYPPITPAVAGVSQQYQTVLAAPAGSAVITNVLGSNVTYRQNIAFHKDVVTIAFAELDVPDFAAKGAKASQDGVSVRVLDYYTGSSDQWGTRSDVLYGYAYQRPEWAVIVADKL